MKHEYQRNIIEGVHKSIEILFDEFHVCPTLFFTENDIVAYFYTILQQNLPITKWWDKDQREHFLVHREYPTPFRCDMSKDKFEVRGEEERTDKGGKYQRGHYDIVILNPDFIRGHSYEVVKGQDYERYKKEVLSRSGRHNPVVLYAVEFMYSRDPLKYSRGKIREKGIDGFIAKVLQDANKLVVSKNRGFIDHIKMLTFVKGSGREICSVLRQKLVGRDEVALCFDQYQRD